MTVDGHDLFFTYDAAGTPLTVSCDGTLYYYITNIQGDVIAIVDTTGTPVVNYTYDAWGNILSATGTQATAIGRYNPLLYRGYVYDTETGLYYLQSRYYNPKVGRFISADEYLSTGQGFTGSNMFVYCGNNPVCRVDFSGQFWAEVWDAITKAAEQTAGYFAFSLGVTQLDTLAPGPADVVGAALLIIGAMGFVGIVIHTTITNISQYSSNIFKEDEKEELIETSPPSYKQAFFTANPYAFTPSGLIMLQIPGSYNGRIIKWLDPITRVAVFEWDEDWKYGPHYHVMKPEWDNDHMGIHYLPGTPVPEPWNTLYFGGTP